MSAGSVEAVVAAIREDVRCEIERIDREAESTIARLRAEDARSPVVLPGGDRRIAEARRAVREQLAGEDWADRCALLEARENWMRRVVEAAQRRLTALAPAERGADVRRLAREAIAILPDRERDVVVAPRDLDLLDAAARADLALAAQTAVHVTASPSVDGGCVAQTRDGALRFDNTYAARSARLEAAWRRPLTRLFDARDVPEPAGAIIESPS